MKVIQQLIVFFGQAGVLSAVQLESLARRGFGGFPFHKKGHGPYDSENCDDCDYCNGQGCQKCGWREYGWGEYDWSTDPDEDTVEDVDDRTEQAVGRVSHVRPKQLGRRDGRQRSLRRCRRQQYDRRLAERRASGRTGR